jgi:rhamnulokinase
MTKKAYLAFDLGAESGRAMLGVLDGGKLALHELHRFANMPVTLPSGLHWNLLELWNNLLVGLRKAMEHCRANSLELASLGVDTWGVDLGLIGRSGQLLGLPYAYRDEHFAPAMDKAIAKVGAEHIYNVTGNQFMPFNSIFQLAYLHQSEPAVLEQADKLLFMPDLLHYFFTGQAFNEATIVSTGQVVDPRRGDGLGVWADGLLKELDVPTQMLGKLIPPGTLLGPVRSALAAELGLGRPLNVIVPASHDTAAAVAAVPASGKGNWLYISSGTWSLQGVELDQPLISEATRAANFTNERGVGGTIRFLTIGAGMWLVQQLRRSFAQRGENYTYSQLADLARAAKPFRTLLNPLHGPFGVQGGMIEKINEFAASTGQPQPGDVGQYVRACLESLALSYRATVGKVETLTGKRIEVIHIVGGGGQNTLLDQMTADAVACPVIAGPFEATAAGNVLTQAMGDGQVADATEIRQIVANSFQPQTYTPKDTAAWDDAYERYLKVLE